MSAGHIEVDGANYKVLDNLGYQHSAGVYAKEVETESGARIAVRPRHGVSWRWWGAGDRVAPLVAWAARKAAEEPSP